MKRTVLVIGRDFHPDGKETAAFIAESLRPHVEKHEYDVEFLSLKDIVFDISTDLGVSVTNNRGEELSEYPVVLMTNWFSHASIRKDIALSLGLYFAHNNIPYFNEEAEKSRSTSKLSQLVIAAYEGVPIARTIFSLNLSAASEKAQSIMSAPFVIKDAQASRGKGNYLLKSFDEVAAHAKDHTEKNPFVFQEFIDNDGSDYRFFVAGDKRRVIKRSGAGDTHLNNTSAGGSAELVSLDDFSDEVKNDVTTMSHRLGRLVTGIDIMFNKNTGKHYFLEANPIPQIATGSFVDEKLETLAEALIEATKENA